MSSAAPGRVRLDKWLWAARFAKTRALAKQAIEGGRVHIDGRRTKVSREIGIGDTLQVRQGFDDITVIVAALSTRRGPAPEARTLYTETPTSIEQRERRSAERRTAQATAGPVTPGRPTKKQRRQIHRFRRTQPE